MLGEGRFIFLSIIISPIIGEGDNKMYEGKCPTFNPWDTSQLSFLVLPVFFKSLSFIYLPEDLLMSLEYYTDSALCWDL